MKPIYNEIKHTRDCKSHSQAGVCPKNCMNRGICFANKCQCDHGFTGESCETQIESACFAKLQRGLCVNPIHQTTAAGNLTTMMTQDACCNSFGIAWGDPCQPCQPGFCGRGFLPSHGICRDINECLIAGICRGGQCTNLEGSYACKCPMGYEFNEETLECERVHDPCARYQHRCSPGGRCIPGKYGDYKCLCNWRYVQAEDQQSCVARDKLTFDFCSVYKGAICQNGVCVRRENSYECVCNEGFESSVDRKSCQHKIDVCAVHRGYLCQNGQCVSAGRDFYCKCNPGFVPSFDRRRCMNMCEQLGPVACPNGQCVAELNGDYHCQCFPGFQTSRDGKHCRSNDRSPPIYSPHESEDTGSEYLPSFLFRSPSRQRMTYFIDRDYQQDKEHVVEIPNRSWIKRRYWGSVKHAARKPPCEQPEILANCAGGFCLNLGGSSYQCECLPDYESVQGNRFCLKPDAQTTNED